jgi:hypothetical protein
VASGRDTGPRKFQPELEADLELRFEVNSGSWLLSATVQPFPVRFSGGFGFVDHSKFNRI